MEKKKNIISLSLVIVLAIVLIGGISSAFFIKTKKQDEMNVIATSACFDVKLEDNKSPINLASAYPISDTDGEATTPYTFKITNICNNKVNYDINLESLENTTFNNSSIKVSFDNNVKLYSLYDQVNTYFESSIDSRHLTSGVLNKKGDSVEYNLRLWIDKDAPVTEQNKIFESKIIINVSLNNQ